MGKSIHVIRARSRDRAPPITMDEFPAGYSWRVALQQSPRPLHQPTPLCGCTRFNVNATSSNGTLSLFRLSQPGVHRTQSYNLLFLLFVQDIGHALGGYKPRRASMCRTLFSLAAFQLITIGRFWVIAEVDCKPKSSLGLHAAPQDPLGGSPKQSETSNFTKPFQQQV